MRSSARSRFSGRSTSTASATPTSASASGSGSTSARSSPSPVIPELYGEPELRQDRTSGGKTFALFSYDLHEGRFRFATFDGKVVSVSTTSSYYTLEDGTAAGEITPNPLAPAGGVVDKRDGRYFWNEYRYQDFGGGCDMWAARGFGAVTELVLPSHGSGRIAGVRIVAQEHARDVPREIGLCR